MSLLKSEKVIVELEKNFDVNSLRYKNLYLWPIIRNWIVTRMERPEYIGPPDKYQGDMHCEIIIPDSDQLAELRKHSDAEFLFVTLPEKHRTSISGKYYNIWLDPYIEYISANHKCIKIEMPSSLTAETLPRYVPTVFLKKSAYGFHIPYTRGCIAGFDRLKELVYSLSGLEIDESRIVMDVNVIEQYKLFYLQILSCICPKVVGHVCWYGIPAMGLMWACNELNITSVDFQHAYNTSHLRYEQWYRIPQDGYELLPDFFYVWSEYFKKGFESKKSGSSKRHRAIAGNNRWMQIVTKQPPEVDGVDDDFIKKLVDRPKVILVTMQGNVPSPEHLFEAVKALPSDWLWLFRFHPGKEGTVKETIQTLASYGIENYEMENASRCPLFVLLKYVHHNLTPYSTSCLEALAFGVPTTFFSYEAYERYHEDIENGFFNCVPSSAEDLMQLLSLEYDKSKLLALSNHFLDMNEQSGQKALNELLAYSAEKEFRPATENLQARNCNWAGMQFLEQDNLERALYSFWNAVRLDQTSTEYLNNLGVVCLCMGRHEDARRCIETALKMNPHDERSISNYQELVNAGVCNKPADSAIIS
ncbi:MAG: tetratricopeptide repeat protein [Sedimentisphaerales bacterium]|nr:tetratricopeptide repeat protein [Sedimentisphaerales bacterium]